MGNIQSWTRHLFEVLGLEKTVAVMTPQSSVLLDILISKCCLYYYLVPSCLTPPYTSFFAFSCLSCQVFSCNALSNLFCWRLYISFLFSICFPQFHCWLPCFSSRDNGHNFSVSRIVFVMIFLFFRLLF